MTPQAGAVTTSADEITELFRGAIRSGLLGDGERLPTVRQTARDFAVAQATAAKAYRALEQDGLVVTRTAAGTRVAPGASRAPQAVIEKARGLVEVSEDAGIAIEEVVAIVRAIANQRLESNTTTHEAIKPTPEGQSDATENQSSEST